MKYYKRVLIIKLICSTIFIFSSCRKLTTTITVKNPTDLIRKDEVIRIKLGDYKKSTDLIVFDTKKRLFVPSQIFDYDKDSIIDEIVFLADLDSREQKKFLIQERKGNLKQNPLNRTTYTRFVPERIDDFAWENDKVAFRTYGPKAKQLSINGNTKGTLSSGIDCWLKKVDYPIINKWYKGNSLKPGYYHVDHGEGLDNYHVGKSRGCGGTGVLFNNKLYASENYVDYEIFSNGPIISEFKLDYEPYEVNGYKIKETKNISIQLGSNFTKYSISIEGTDTISAGIFLNNFEGKVTKELQHGWINYCSPHYGDTLVTSIITNPEYLAGFSIIESENKDESHALMHLKVIDGKVEFYSGYFWSPSQHYENLKDYETYLNHFSKSISNPLIVEVY